MGRILLDLQIQDGGQAPEPLGAYAEGVDLLEQLQAQLLDRVRRPARLELVNVDVLHQGLLGQQHGLLRRATDTDAEHPRGAPAGTHRGHGAQHPIHQAIAGIEDGELGLVLGAATLGRQPHLDLVAGHQIRVDYGRGVVAGVLTLPDGWRNHGCAQHIVRVGIGATHALVHHLLDAQLRFPAHIHADPQEDYGHSRVLADWTMALGTHPGVEENLCHGVFCRRGLLHLVGRGQGTNVVLWMIVGDVLKTVGDTLDEIFLADSGHVTDLPYLLTP